MSDKCVYEMCDTSTGEMYFPMGIFETIEAALNAVKIADEAKEALSEHGRDSGESETISIYKRKFGLTEHGENILEITRVASYGFDDYEYEVYWQTDADGLKKIKKILGCEG